MTNPVEYETLGEAICTRLTEEIRKLGFAEQSLPPFPVYGQACFTYVTDPFSGLDSLVGIWRDARGDRLGEITKVSVFI